MKRIAVFLLISIGVLILLSISMSLLGLESLFTANYGLEPGILLVFAVIVGFAGSFMFLVASTFAGGAAKVCCSAIPRRRRVSLPCVPERRDKR